MDYNPFLPEVQDNPYPYYAYLRRHAPVYLVPDVGMWAISRYDEVLSILRNPQVFSSSILTAAMTGDLYPFSPQAAEILSADPPTHTRLRKLANRAFTPRRIAGLEAHMRETVQQLLDQMATHETCDLMRDLAIPLPGIAIAELLGVPVERRQDFRRWSDHIARGFNGTALSADERTESRQSITDLHAYLRAAIETYRKRPSDTFLSDLVRAEEEEQRLTADEVLNLAVITLGAGNETTTNLIGNAMLALFDYPEQMAKVRANPTLVSNLVEEALRYEPPVQWFPRLTTQEVTLADTTLPAGTVIMAMFASANRDERKFPDSERFDISRNADGHVTFGFGVHFCLGAQLARLEGRVVLEMLLQRFPRLARAEGPVLRMQNPSLRGLKTLPLMLT